MAHPTDSQLITAVRLEEEESALDAALAAGVDINQKDRLGFTPLMLAIKAGSARWIYKLLNAPGVDVNCKSKVSS